MGKVVDDVRMAGARRWAATMRPYSTGVYVNVISDPGSEGVTRAYRSGNLARLADLKRTWDPDNRFRYNANIPPA
jgi:hypothetical protein